MALSEAAYAKPARMSAKETVSRLSFCPGRRATSLAFLGSTLGTTIASQPVLSCTLPSKLPTARRALPTS
eukprot:8990234-Alexandrium_andersonii.AAC.1